MVYKVSVLLYAFINLCKLFLIKSFNIDRLHFSLPVLGKSTTIILKGNGSLILSNLRSRIGLTVLVEDGNINIDKNCFFNNYCSLNCLSGISIGEGSIFGENVKVYDHDHLYTIEYGVSANEFSTGVVKIGKKCWFGSNTVILKGVSICDNVVVGSNSVVTKSIDTPGVYVMKGSCLSKVR